MGKLSGVVASIVCASLLAHLAQGTIISEFIGANPGGLATVALDENFAKHITPGLAWNLILGFARSDGTASGPAGSSFVPHWDTNTLTPDAILAFRNRFDNLRVLFSIGGDGEVWQEQSDCGAWSDAALASIESIIAQYNLDGVDFDYEQIPSGSPTFSPCLQQLITKYTSTKPVGSGNLPPLNIVSFSPFGPTNGFYQDIFKNVGDNVNMINYQAYADLETSSSTSDYQAKFKSLLTQYPAAKLLMGIDTNTKSPRGQQFSPPNGGIFSTFKTLSDAGIIGGAMIFTAEDSAEDGGSNGSGFALEDALTAFIQNPN